MNIALAAIPLIEDRCANITGLMVYLEGPDVIAKSDALTAASQELRIRPHRGETAEECADAAVDRLRDLHGLGADDPETTREDLELRLGEECGETQNPAGAHVASSNTRTKKR